MKRNRFSVIILCCTVALWVVAPLRAQEAKTLFINMPDSLCPLLTKVNREDCIDFLESKMRAIVTNRFDQKTEMTDLGKDYIRLQMTPQSTWQMKVLALNDSTSVVCTVATVCAPACDSDICFYTTDWQPLEAEAFIQLPTMDDFITPPDSLSDDIYAYREARLAADVTLLQVDLSKDAPALSVSLTTPDYMVKETAEKLQPFLRRPILYRWKEGKFTSTPQ